MSDSSLPSCRHRGGEFAPCRSVCLSPRLVAARGVTPEVCREICPWVDHESRPQGADESAASLGEEYGVAIGTFDSRHLGEQRYGTEAVKLNLAVLRDNCGAELKILVCDDASPPESQKLYRRSCREYDAEFTTNPQRMGHTSGDMIVFHKAVRWAQRLGLRTVTKLSQRMMIDVPGWIQSDSELLLSSPFATHAQMLTNFGCEQVRTECVMMVVERWSSSGVMWHYRPRRIPYWNEGHTFDAIARLVDPEKPYPHFLPWQRLSYERGGDAPPVYFREMRDADELFRDLAGRHGIELTSAFSTIDSCRSTDYQ